MCVECCVLLNHVCLLAFHLLCIVHKRFVRRVNNEGQRQTVPKGPPPPNTHTHTEQGHDTKSRGQREAEHWRRRCERQRCGGESRTRVDDIDKVWLEGGAANQEAVHVALLPEFLAVGRLDRACVCVRL